MPSEFDVAAVHEAGHAVARVRLGILHAGASIFSGDEGRVGWATGEGVETEWSVKEAQQHLLAYCAGFAALVAAGCDARSAAGLCDDDFRTASSLITFWDLDGDLDDWRFEAIELMREPKNVAAVALVAEQLRRHGKLDGDHVDVLVELADGEITQAAFDHYLTLRAP